MVEIGVLIYWGSALVIGKVPVTIWQCRSCPLRELNSWGHSFASWWEGFPCAISEMDSREDWLLIPIPGRVLGALVLFWGLNSHGFL
jgi:hypothetical protein